VTPTAEWNFAGRLVKRLGPCSYLIADDLPGGTAAADSGIWRLLDIRWFEGGRSSADWLFSISLQHLGLFGRYLRGSRGGASGRSRGHSFSNDASGSNGRQSRVDRSGPSGPEALRKDLFFVCMVT
jgi:hypothetical protein